MFTKVLKGGNGSIGGQKGLTAYLEKENEGKPEHEHECFFTHDKEVISPDGEVQLEHQYNIKPDIVTSKIDSMRGGLKSFEQKQYQLILSPSEEELNALSDNDLKEYTKEFMDKAYANNFCKQGVSEGLKSKDFVWFAKLEFERTYKGDDKEVKAGLKKSGQKKEGDQRHVHIIVSRKTADNKLQRSPYSQNKGENKRVGFPRDKMRDKAETLFDEKFRYIRENSEKWRHANIRVNGTGKEQLELQKMEREPRRSYLMKSMVREKNQLINKIKMDVIMKLEAKKTRAVAHYEKPTVSLTQPSLPSKEKVKGTQPKFNSNVKKLSTSVKSVKAIGNVIKQASTSSSDKDEFEIKRKRKNQEKEEKKKSRGM